MDVRGHEAERHDPGGEMWDFFGKSGSQCAKRWTMDWHDRIVIDPEILAGKPVIRGTRLAVEFIIDLLAKGWSEQQITENYEGLTSEDVRACLAYASEVLREERVYPLASG